VAWLVDCRSRHFAFRGDLGFLMTGSVGFVVYQFFTELRLKHAITSLWFPPTRGFVFHYLVAERSHFFVSRFKFNFMNLRINGDPNPASGPLSIASHSLKALVVLRKKIHPEKFIYSEYFGDSTSGVIDYTKLHSRLALLESRTIAGTFTNGVSVFKMELKWNNSCSSTLNILVIGVAPKKPSQSGTAYGKLGKL